MRGLALLLLCAVMPSRAAAQPLPSAPVSIAEGRIVLGGEASVSVAPQDLGFFNYSDYEHSTLRELRLGVSALVRATDRISVLGELRSENLNHVMPFALYARIRPFPGRRLDVQVGRIPPTFGRMSRQAYGRGNPLIGTPLAYQYLTSLRPDAIPATRNELLDMRGRGWLASYSAGSPDPARGVPLVSSFTWDTGVQVSAGWNMVTVAGAITHGTASNPRFTDDNSGKQIASRVEITPAAGLAIGGSYARGDFLNRRIKAQLGAGGDRAYHQRAHGVDVEYSRDHWVVRAEGVLSEWEIPFAAEGPDPYSLRAAALAVEGKYAVLPGVYAAVRAERLGFNRIAGSSPGVEWEAPVTRIEVGGGYYLQRNLLARASLQINERDGGRVTSARLLAAQLLFWF